MLYVDSNVGSLASPFAERAQSHRRTTTSDPDPQQRPVLQSRLPLTSRRHSRNLRPRVHFPHGQKTTLTDLDTKLDELTAIIEKGLTAVASDIAGVQNQANSIELEPVRYKTRLGNLETKIFGVPRR